jgi:hypothetical protein
MLLLLLCGRNKLGAVELRNADTRTTSRRGLLEIATIRWLLLLFRLLGIFLVVWIVAIEFFFWICDDFESGTTVGDAFF